jgi:hypothetical protein
MFSLLSWPRACRLGMRSIVSVPLCMPVCVPLPQAPQTNPPRAAIGQQADGGPGWYGSSWELGRGLEIAEVPDADAELALWLDVWLNPRPATEPA